MARGAVPMAVVSFIASCSWVEGADGSWGLYADVNIATFSLTQAEPDAVFDIESEYTPETFPEGQMLNVRTFAMVDTREASDQAYEVVVKLADSPGDVTTASLTSSGCTSQSCSSATGDIVSQGPDSSLVEDCRSGRACLYGTQLSLEMISGQQVSADSYIESDVFSDTVTDQGTPPEGSRLKLSVWRVRGGERILIGSDTDHGGRPCGAVPGTKAALFVGWWLVGSRLRWRARRRSP